MVSITRWEMTHTLHLCLGLSTAKGSLNNSCLILVSQSPSSARERKIRQGGNQNRDWGRHIRLAQSKSSGYKTVLTSPVVTGITCSKYDILTANSLKGWVWRQFNIISSNVWYTLHLADQSTNCSWKEIKVKERKKRQHQKAVCHNKHLTDQKSDGSFLIFILSYSSLVLLKHRCSVGYHSLMASWVVFCSKWGIVEHSIFSNSEYLLYKENIN